MNRRTSWASLLLTTALSTSALAGHALAQAPAQPAADSAAQGSDTLSDIVVTATRQADTVNRVSLSISAETQKSLDQQGVKTVQDLGRTVPALQISGNNNSMTPSLAIRGIAASTGAATTGVYLDDTPLTKRQVSGSGGNTNGNGTPVPPLFDLERVEVLRGPQGTLYGGSSEGGTVRFITPTPSLTSYSGNVRVEASATGDGGAPSWEAGIAAGGPLVEDKLGLRISAYTRIYGGYIDRVNIFDNDAISQRNINTEKTGSLRGVLLWAPTEDLRVTLAGFTARDVQRDANTSFKSMPYTLNEPQLCFNTLAASKTAAVPCPAGSVPGTTSPAGIYTRPATSYGPYNLGPYQTIYSFALPSQTNLDTGSLTLDYDLKAVEAKLVSSVIHDSTRAITYDTSQVTNAESGGFGAAQGFGITALLPQYPAQGVLGYFSPINSRTGITEELRLSSPGDARPLSWVAGAYYSRIKGLQTYNNYEDLTLQGEALYGLTATQRNGNPLLPAPNAGSAAYRYQTLVDTEKAIFGEANLYLTSKLKLTAGLRYSDEEFSYYQVFYGPLSGFNVPTTANGGLTNGGEDQKPLTPKGGITYQFTDNDLVYATAAKGFRPGGVNGPLSAQLCTGLAQQGLTPSNLPSTYNSDSVWSYEAGAKLRLFENRVQLNASAYHITWSGVQLQVSTTGCGQTYVLNAGSAESDGFDTQIEAKLFHGLTGNLAVGYDNARYTADAFGPTPTNGTAPTKVVNNGDKFPVPPWTVTLGLQYDWTLSSGMGAYLRGDYQYSSNYLRGLGASVNSYAPDVIGAQPITIVNARAGVTRNGWDINLFVKNLLNENGYYTLGGGRGGCAVATGAACTTFSTYNPLFSGIQARPREIGIQASMRY